MFKVILAYYTNNNNSVYCTFVDITKAFDRIHYCKYFVHIASAFCN